MRAMMISYLLTYLNEKAGLKITQEAMLVLAVGATLYSAIAGFLFSQFLDERAFHTKINSVICFFGGALALIAVLVFAPSLLRGNFTGVIITMAIGSTVFMMAAIWLKDMFLERLSAHMTENYIATLEQTAPAQAQKSFGRAR